MAINLDSLSNLTTAATALSNLIMVSPQKTVGYQPQNYPSFKKDTSALPPTILFNYEGEQSVTLTSDITDHFIENNTAIQDQIALKPITITTSGFIGELNDVAPAALQPLKTVAQKLTPLGPYAPQLSATAIIAYNNALLAYTVGANLINSAVSTWSSISGKGGTSVINGAGITEQPNQNKQQIYFQQFYGYFQRRTLFTVQTPWAIFQDMAIQSLRSVQDAETRVITDFEITFKQMRFASTLSISAGSGTNAANLQGRLSSQAGSLVDLGTSALQPSSVSFLGSVA